MLRISVYSFCFFALVIASSSFMGCTSSSPSAAKEPEIKFELTTNPSPPRMGDAYVELKMTSKLNAPIVEAQVKLEGNMNHAGMKPIFAELTESKPGVYEGKLDFTMAGAWYVEVTAKLADGKEVKHKIDIPDVKR